MGGIIDFTNGTVADADEVNSNFTTVYNVVKSIVQVAISAEKANCCYDNILQDRFTCSCGAYQTVDTGNSTSVFDTDRYRNFYCCCCVCPTMHTYLCCVGTNSSVSGVNASGVCVSAGGSAGKACLHNCSCVNLKICDLNAYDIVTFDLYMCQCWWGGTNNAFNCFLGTGVVTARCCSHAQTTGCSPNPWSSRQYVQYRKTGDNAFDVYEWTTGNATCTGSKSGADCAICIKVGSDGTTSGSSDSNSGRSWVLSCAWCYINSYVLIKGYDFGQDVKDILLTYNGCVETNASIKYDVINADTEDVIGCDLVPNTIQTLTTPHNHIKVKIKQNTSCVANKSEIQSFGYYVGFDI